MSEAALLAAHLPSGDPVSVRATARSLDAVAAELATLSRRGSSVLEGTWRGDAAVSAAVRITRLASRLYSESRRCSRAAEVLWVFATRLDWALDQASAARRLLDAAFTAQRRADTADPSLALGHASVWTGSRGADAFTDPDAAALAARARSTAASAVTVARRANDDLVRSLSALTGLSVERQHLSPRLLLDVAGFVPVVGDAVDAVNGLAYLLHGDELAAGLSFGAVVPGPFGWASTSGRIGKALTDDELVEVVRRTADPLQARHVDPAFVALYRDRDRLITRAAASADQSVRPLHSDLAQLRKKRHRAADLFDEPLIAPHLSSAPFEQRLRAFVDADTTVLIGGTYRREPSLLYVDTVDMRRVVFTHPDGKFWSGWVMDDRQAKNVWERHALQ